MYSYFSEVLEHQAMSLAQASDDFSVKDVERANLI